jgi:hypothetical protein
MYGKFICEDVNSFSKLKETEYAVCTTIGLRFANIKDNVIKIPSEWILKNNNINSAILINENTIIVCLNIRLSHFIYGIRRDT